MAAKMRLARIAKRPVPVNEQCQARCWLKLRDDVPCSSMTLLCSVRVPIGETSHITFTEVIVDEKDLSTYINPDAELRQKTINTVRIRREEDGYHLNLGAPDLDFTPKKIENHSKLLPAVEITEEIEPAARKELRDMLTQTDKETGETNATPQSNATGAQMIPSRIAPPPKALSEAPAHGTEYIFFTDVVVDQKNGSTYVRQDATLITESNPFAVRIGRDPDGCRVILYQKLILFRPRQIANYSKLIPAVEVIEEVEPDVLER